MRENCLIKLSGDTIDLSDELIKFITEKSKLYHVTILVGGGKQINEAYEKAGFAVIFGKMGRETNSLRERQTARDVLELNQSKVQDALADVNVEVVIPVINIGSVLCHINGDQYVLSAYNGFHKIFIVTLPERIEKKKEQFKEYDKIETVDFK